MKLIQAEYNPIVANGWLTQAIRYLSIHNTLHTTVIL